MTAFGKTLVGKALGGTAKGVVKAAIDSNPITRSANNLLSGFTSQKKDAAKSKVSAQKTISKASSPSETGSATGGNMFTKNKTLLGFTFPLWIWAAIIVGILLLFWFVYKRLFKKRRGASGHRRSSSSSAMRARMARVRAARRKRK